MRRVEAGLDYGGTLAPFAMHIDTVDHNSIRPLLAALNSAYSLVFNPNYPETAKRFVVMAAGEIHSEHDSLAEAVAAIIAAIKA